MRGDLFDFSARGWGRVALWTAIGTGIAVAVSVIADSHNVFLPDGVDFNQLLWVSIGIPVAVAVPVLLFFAMKLRELAIAHHELAQLAATDSLTEVLSRRAFTTLVEAYLADTRRLPRDTHGALLVVDADNFKSINDSYGHDRGDEALRTIARSIKSVLRNADIVGRIGGEEFGVFLPGAGPEQAKGVAERIRDGVEHAPFLPDGRPRRLSVSVGGAVFERQLAFADLFRVADQQLYRAKETGRNRTVVSPVANYESVPTAA